MHKVFCLSCVERRIPCMLSRRVLCNLAFCEESAQDTLGDEDKVEREHYDAQWLGKSPATKVHSGNNSDNHTQQQQQIHDNRRACCSQRDAAVFFLECM